MLDVNVELWHSYLGTFHFPSYIHVILTQILIICIERSTNVEVNASGFFFQRVYSLKASVTKVIWRTVVHSKHGVSNQLLILATQKYN